MTFCDGLFIPDKMKYNSLQYKHRKITTLACKRSNYVYDNIKCIARKLIVSINYINDCKILFLYISFSDNLIFSRPQKSKKKFISVKVRKHKTAQFATNEFAAV